jgi:hypothetical protein
LASSSSNRFVCLARNAFAAPPPYHTSSLFNHVFRHCPLPFAHTQAPAFGGAAGGGAGGHRAGDGGAVGPAAGGAGGDWGPGRGLRCGPRSGHRGMWRFGHSVSVKSPGCVKAGGRHPRGEPLISQVRPFMGRNPLERHLSRGAGGSLHAGGFPVQEEV